MNIKYSLKLKLSLSLKYLVLTILAVSSVMGMTDVFAQNYGQPPPSERPAPPDDQTSERPAPPDDQTSERPAPQSSNPPQMESRNQPPSLEELRQVRSENYGERFGNITQNMSDERINELQSRYNNLRTGEEPNADNRISPRQQMIIGVDAEEIICVDGRELILRTSNGLPACVTSNTASILTGRGLAIPVDGTESLSVTGDFFGNQPHPPVNGTQPPQNGNPPPPVNGTTAIDQFRQPPPPVNGTQPPQNGNPPPPVNGTGGLSPTNSLTDDDSTYTDDNGNSITISGGHETDAVDGGRPVYLIGTILGITGEEFRDAFSYVTPEENGHLNEETAQANKEQLLAQLEPYGITNEQIDEATNYYRYLPGSTEIWPYTHAVLTATVDDEGVVSFEIVSGGNGYTSEPIIIVDGYGEISVNITISYTDTFSTNGAITVITVQ